MKMIYNILYKNGHEDVIEQEITEDNASSLKYVNDVILESMNEDASGVITIGGSKSNVSFIRLSEVIRVSVKIEGQAE